MREKVPGVALRTTLIVGHPGETEACFKELVEFVKEARFQRMGAFTYSEEEGTFGAEHFKDSIRPSVKQKRLNELMEVQRGISLAYNQSRIGTETRVLVDGFSDGILVCRSEFESPEVDGEILVKYSADAFGGAQPQSLVGKFLSVRITAADDYDLSAEVIC
jgi:ribosomal protein S12 methylthiotransferase